MTYNITRKYDTDFSRTDVRTIAANVAKELADAADYDIPTKTVFEEPEIIDEDDNRFELPVRPTVTDAGFAPEDLLGSVNYNGKRIELLGMVQDDGDRDTLHIRVIDSESNHELDIDDKKDVWASIH